MEITGKAHNPENAELAEDYIRLYKQTPALQLPSTFRLNAPVRSNRTAENLSDEDVIEDMIMMIIASSCDWNTLLNKVAQDMKKSTRPVHQIISFGMNDCVPVMPFNRQRLKTTKFEAHVLIEPIKSAQTARIDSVESPVYSDNAIAITGASCRLPGANNLDELWEIISRGLDRHQELPKDRFYPHSIFRVSQSGTDKAKKFFGNFLEDVRGFDRAYFGMGMKEAANIDPQQRLLLELAVEALEASGYLATHVREAGDRVGCFVGASFIEYLENTSAHPPTAYTAPGTIRAFLCGRLSYYFGWTAPAEVIDTACSASMVAINRACKSIQAGECEMALAGGVNLITGMNNYLDLGKASFLSPTGQCKPFDQAGDGYCRSDGAGFVVLKKLKQAIIDGDPIMGVISGIATNQGGLSTALTVPSSTALQALYRTVLSQSGLQPSQVTYVEAHGTGTQAGDPIEIESLRSVLGDTTRPEVLSIGSIKGNIGHCETGAGVAGLLKVLAMIQHGSIPPLASHKLLNPKIPALETDGLEICKTLRPWNVPLRAALVNSYGAAGSNSALICCEPPTVSPEVSILEQRETQLVSWPVIISGATRKSLFDNAQILAKHLSQKAHDANMKDLTFILNQRRKKYRFCADVKANDALSLAQSLRAISMPTFEHPVQHKPVVLIFSGQNTNVVALNRAIYDSYPSFRANIDACDLELIRLGFPTIRAAVFQTEPIVDTTLLQCSIFAVQYACARCWIDAGFKPQAIIGHSFGELTALAISGALSLEDSLKLVTCRADLINTRWGSEKGGMLVIHAGIDTVQEVLAQFRSVRNGAELEIACYNSPTTTVVAGTSADIDAAENMISTDPLFSGLRKLRISTSHAFHSSLSNPILADLDAMADSLTWHKPQIPLEACTKEPLNGIHEWSASRHTRGSVYFTRAVARIEQRLGPCIWLEAGLDSAIISMARKASLKSDTSVFQPVSTKTGAAQFVSDIVSGLWRHGLSLSHWNHLPGASRPKHIWLPPYQFEKEPYWTEHVDRAAEVYTANASTSATLTLPDSHQQVPPKLVSILTPKTPEPNSVSFQINTQCDRFQKITAGHAVLHQPLCPASLYMECVIMAIGELIGDLGGRTLDFEGLEFHAGLGLETTRYVTLGLEQDEMKHAWKFSVQSSRPGSSRTLGHCSGKVMLSHDPIPAAFQRLVEGPIGRLDGSLAAERLMSPRAYGLFSVVMTYADFLKPISSIILEKREALATVRLPPHQPGLHESTAWQRCDAVFLDGFLSSSGLLLNSSDLISSTEVMIAVGVERAIITSDCQANLAEFWQSYATFTAIGDTHALCDIFVCSPEREVVAIMTGVRFNKMETSKLAKSLSSVNSSLLNKSEISPTLGHKVKSLQSSIKPPGAPPSLAALAATSVNTSQDSGTTLESESVKPAEPTNGATESILLRLKSLISEYVGLNVDDVPEDSPLVDLGLDSLSSIEFASDIQSKWGAKLDSDEVSEMTLFALSQKLSPVSNSSPVEQTTSTYDGTRMKTRIHNDVAPILKSLIASYTGLDEDDIPDDVPLIDLGLDSLSCIEFASELHVKLGVEVDASDMEDLTLQGLGQQLQTTDSCSTVSSSDTAATPPYGTSTGATTPFPTGLSTPAIVVPSAKKASFSDDIGSSSSSYEIKTVEYKRVSGTPIHADIYMPSMAPAVPMPIGMHPVYPHWCATDELITALMIHGGGFMTLSRKAVRPAQAKWLIANGLLPVSIDYRLCPEVNLIDGPITDTRDAYAWASREMPALLSQYGISVDRKHVVAVGWSTGGQLAMSLGWTTQEIGLPPPSAVLSFYAPVDFESGGQSPLPYISRRKLTVLS